MAHFEKRAANEFNLTASEALIDSRWDLKESNQLFIFFKVLECISSFL